MKTNRPTQSDKIISMMKTGWVSPLDAMRELSCMSFGKRVAEIRRHFTVNDEYILEEQWIKRINRFGEKVQFKEFRLINSEYKRSKERHAN